MKNKKHPTIAIFMGDNYTEYSTELVHGFCSCAKAEQVNLIFLMRSCIPHYTNNIISNMSGDDFQVHFSSIYDYAPLFKPDAFVLAYGSLSNYSDTPDKQAFLSHFRGTGTPCLLLEDISENPDIPYLTADNYTGMRDCIQHLITEHGYRKIAFLAGPKGNNDSDERLRAYYDSMQESGLTVTDTMVTHGDFSDLVDTQVNYLLDSNPELEAIAFANDSMAKCGYRICNERGLIVGQDLAITGFDDAYYAKTLNPPLTSVMHSSYLFSYRALQNAIRLCNGIAPSPEKVPTILQKRSSCGCPAFYHKPLTQHATKEEIIQFVHENTNRIVEDFFFSIPYPEKKQRYKDLLLDFFLIAISHIWNDSTNNFSFNHLFPYIKRLCDNPDVSSTLMLDHVTRILNMIIPHAPGEAARAALLNLIASVQQYVLSAELVDLQITSQWEQHQNWLTYSFIQNLLTSHVRFCEVIQSIFDRLKCMNLESCYFFLLKQPLERDISFCLRAPDNLYLAAYYNESTTVALNPEDWIHITSGHGVTDQLPPDKQHSYTTYVLFSGKTQYGFLLCENEPKDIPFILACSMQIASFLHFYLLNSSESAVRQKLEASLELIKEQNSILNFISEYDELTKLLNRRGFMGKALQAISNNMGKSAYVVFADLDHLKELNDVFGHSAGDFALQTVAGYLRSCLPPDAIIARISGDEFVAFIISDAEDFEQHTKQTMKEEMQRFNQTSDKPYYVEMSFGIYRCNCDSTASITDLLHETDTLLYKEKKHRRESIRK